jgi:hypothetical protein
MAKTKKFLFVSCAAASLIVGGAAVVWAHGGEHHAQPGYSAGHDCVLNNNFHNYDHQSHYGTDKNVWCNGSGQQLSPHHGGGTVQAALPTGSSFVGGFCVKASLSGETVLIVNYKDVVAHDRVWLKAEDSAYYPIDRLTGEAFIQVEDNGWVDRNPLPGQVETEVLFSYSNENPGINPGTNPGTNPDISPGAHRDGGAGGCNLAGLGAVFFLMIPPFFLRRRKGNSLPDDIEWQ